MRRRVELLDEEGDLTPPLHAALQTIFLRFSSHPNPRPSSDPGTAALATAPAAAAAASHAAETAAAAWTEEDLDDWATATNGEPLPESSKREIRDFLDTDDQQRLTLRGFLSMYHLQTDNDPQETWRDLKAHGFDEQLRAAHLPAYMASRRRDAPSSSRTTNARPPIGTGGPAASTGARNLATATAAAATRPKYAVSSLPTLVAALRSHADRGDDCDGGGGGGGGVVGSTSSEALHDELVALESIYGEGSVRLLDVLNPSGLPPPPPAPPRPRGGGGGSGQRAKAHSSRTTTANPSDDARHHHGNRGGALGGHDDDDDDDDDDDEAMQWGWVPGVSRLRLEVRTTVETDEPSWGGTSVEASASDPVAAAQEGVDVATAAPSMRLAVTLPAGYPETEEPPQLQLMGRYIGSLRIDQGLFVDVLRAFWRGGGGGGGSGGAALQGQRDEGGGVEGSDVGGGGLEWRRGEVALFESVEWVRERVRLRSEEETSRRHAGGQRNEAPRRVVVGKTADGEDDDHLASTLHSSLRVSPPTGQPPPTASSSSSSSSSSSVDWSKRIFSSAELVERKSVFLGHAARIERADDVEAIVRHLLTRDPRRLAKATHPLMQAWTVRAAAPPSSAGTAAGALIRDHDDDGETAAGGRLAHLLEVLKVEGVWVGVTRWYGGVQLGAARFKLINRAARDALEKAGIVAAPSSGA